MAKLPRVTCPVCHADVAVLVAGELVRQHLDNREPYRAGRPNWCQGTHQPNACDCADCRTRRSLAS